MNCPICDTMLVTHHVGRTEMLRCPSCTVIVRPPSLAPTQGAAYYESSYTLTHTVRASTEMHRYFRYPEYQRLLGAVLKVKPTAASWLDVGCDHGFFLDDARRYGLTVVGVEPATQARLYALRIGLDVKKDLAEVDGQFDVVSMWHVLEHIEDPSSMLASLHARMNDEAVLAIRVPDAGSFWSRLLKDRWIWFQPQNHALHYSEGSLRSLLLASGFTIEFIRRQRPNSLITRKAYHLSRRVMRDAFGTSRTSFRDLVARTYQDVCGQELFALVRKR